MSVVVVIMMVVLLLMMRMIDGVEVMTDWTFLSSALGVNEGGRRAKDETKEEKAARKAAVKEAR